MYKLHEETSGLHIIKGMCNRNNKDCDGHWKLLKYGY